ncbi:hypothetical protein J6590_106081 [Homalodisca vitripennis]|nr:hypothetical protein J6590_106081 [Homalodisca vitripennis]
MSIEAKHTSLGDNEIEDLFAITNEQAAESEDGGDSDADDALDHRRPLRHLDSCHESDSDEALFSDDSDKDSTYTPLVNNDLFVGCPHFLSDSDESCAQDTILTKQQPDLSKDEIAYPGKSGKEKKTEKMKVEQKNKRIKVKNEDKVKNENKGRKKKHVSPYNWGRQFEKPKKY